MKFNFLSLFLSLSVAHGLLLGAADSIQQSPNILKVSRLEKLLRIIEKSELNHKLQIKFD